ncbi:hypothetical protein RM780_22420 [Streptomyces sp. DSM 44917]|uniref:Uncharacterized protein n=1 Tax=Streptomyces boetiae TaxID=3075541 RepID=A0ABU2LDN9_9ACTN|nr:hypothetical protein [Streptomyces sp. DSM 44917]MDT0309691.1 hypothetical protein [Streptomyces sp. DSM 44917]
MLEITGNCDGFIDLPRELGEDLIGIVKTLPVWNMDGVFLEDSTMEQYRAALDSAPLFDEFQGRLLSMLGGAAGGYAVVHLRSIAQVLGIGDDFLRLVTAILAGVAIPFQPFRRWPLWKEIGTNLNAGSWSSPTT